MLVNLNKKKKEKSNKHEVTETFLKTMFIKKISNQKVSHLWIDHLRMPNEINFP